MTCTHNKKLRSDKENKERERKVHPNVNRHCLRMFHRQLVTSTEN